jgi:hypothetical protein
VPVFSIEDVAKRVRKRLQLDQDFTIVLSGYEGSGKSTLGAALGLSIDPSFSFERNELYSPSTVEMIRKVRGLPKGSIIINDEAIKTFYKLRWQDKRQHYLNQFMTQCRKENKGIILCIPRFTDLNEYMRNHRVRMWIEIIDPVHTNKKVGYAVVMGKTWNPFNRDPWNIQESQKIIKDYMKKRRMRESEFSLREKVRLLSRLPNYIGVLQFGHIKDDLWAKYCSLRDKYKYEDTDEVDILSKRETLWKVRMLALIHHIQENNLMERKDIYETSGIPKHTFYALEKEIKKKYTKPLPQNQGGQVPRTPSEQVPQDQLPALTL